MEKKPKTYFFIQCSFCPLNGEKVIFLDITSAELLSLQLIRYRCCNLCLMTCNTSLLVWQGVSNIFLMLNYFAHLTNFKHFGSSTSHVHIQFHDTFGQHEAGDWIWTCKQDEGPKCLKFVRYFCFYSASAKTRYGFCSCSKLLQLKFGKKKFSREMQIAQPPIQL